MRTLTDQEKYLYQKGKATPHMRLDVWDGTAWRDLTSLAGRNWMKGARWTEQLDEPTVELEVDVRRERYYDSFAPLQTSRLNTLTGSYDRLLDVGRPVRLYVALVPPLMEPTSTDWRLVFEGLLWEVEVGSPIVRLRCFDKSHDLKRLWIDREREYGSPSGVALETVIQKVIKDNHGQAWATGLVLSATTGDRVTPTTQNGYWYLCTVSGTTSGSEPSWPTTIGNTVTSGTATLRCEGTCPTLWVPVATSAVRTTYVQRQVSVMAAITDLAALIGWDIRYRYRASSGQFELCLYQPDRAAIPGDESWTWSPGNYTLNGYDLTPSLGEGYYCEVLSSGSDLDDLRTDVVLDYPNSAVLQADGTPTRTRLQKTDLAARANYNNGNPRFFFVVEGAATQINTASEANTFATALLQDVSLPPQRRRISTVLFPFAEVQDYHCIRANGVDGDTDEFMGLIRLEHAIGGDGEEGGDPGTTIFTYRGTRPARRTMGRGFGTWGEKLAFPLGNSGAPPSAGPAAPTNVTATKVQGGVAITFDPDTTYGKKAEVHELHLSTSSSGFTPDDTTFRMKARGTTRFEVGDLVPGTTYYAKVVPQDERQQRGTASSAVTIEAGYTTPASMQPIVSFGTMPPNPDFEAANDPSGPPDTWTMVPTFGTWGTDATTSTSTVYSGGRSLRFPATAVQTKIQSQLFAVIPNTFYFLRAVMQCTTFPNIGDGLTAQLKYYSDLGVTETTTADTVNLINGAAATWVDNFHIGNAALVPSNAKYGRVIIAKTTANAYECFIDSVVVGVATLYQQSIKEIAAGAMLNSWVTYASGTEPRYWRDAAGNVHLTGTIKNGTMGSAAFVLPTGHRPTRAAAFPTVSAGVFGACTIDTSGNVVPATGSNTSFNLDGIVIVTGAYNSA